MEVFDGRYYKSSKLCLKVIGLWPYQKDSVRIISNTIFCIINMSLALPQAILLVQKWGKDFYITYENTASLLFATACVAKYVVTYTSASRLKPLFVQIAKDWQKIQDEEERKILIKYYEQARFLVIFYTIYLFYAWLIYTSMPLAPFFLDLMFPLQNGTRSILLPFYANYVIFEQTDYHYWACGHMAVVYFTSFFLYSGVDGTYVLSVKHACGLFAITCNRTEKVAVSKDNHSTDLFSDNDGIIQRHLSETVSLHNETIRCCYLLEDSFNRLFIVVQFMSVIVLAMCGVYILVIYNNTFKLLRVVAFFVGILIHLSYLNWVGQQIIDSSEQVFDSTYCSNWYLISPNARKFTNVIMCRSLNPCQLTAGKITTLSMESFGILIKTAMSYFTVFLSVS